MCCCLEVIVSQTFYCQFFSSPKHEGFAQGGSYCSSDKKMVKDLGLLYHLKLVN